MYFMHDNSISFLLKWFMDKDLMYTTFFIEHWKLKFET